MSSFYCDIPSWFAIYVKCRHEKHVALSLEAKAYHVFLPTYVKEHERRKRFDVPLFPGYVFCRLNPTDTLPILSTPGVFSIVGNGPKAIPIPDEEIDGIQRLLDSNLGRRPCSYVSVGEEVYVTAGPLRGLKGVVVDERHEKWLVLSIHLLRRSVAAKVDRSYLVDSRQWLMLPESTASSDRYVDV
jgi:transcription termination/antitermination protein NusG